MQLFVIIIISGTTKIKIVYSKNNRNHSSSSEESTLYRICIMREKYACVF